MDIVIKLSHEEATRLPYLIIAETTSRSIWNTSRRKREMEREFTSEEHKDIDAIIHIARRWAGHGVPQEVMMENRMLILWKRLGNFCYKL